MPYRTTNTLTRAEDYLSNLLRLERLPVITPYLFFRKLQLMYAEGENLYLKHSQPNLNDYSRFVKKLYSAGLIRYDNDYGTRLIRVMEVPEKSAEDVICLADPLCYISHLSAMQSWGLTDRSPRFFILTRPDRKTATVKYTNIMAESSFPLPPKRVRLHFIEHPEKVRRVPLLVYESNKAGAQIKIPGTNTRVATIGQTFLDMLQFPRKCGGMPHVLDIFEAEAETWADEIINAVETSASSLVKCRAGHILEERLGISDDRIDAWKKLAQRGGNRKLDPLKEYSPRYSETWMLSINV